MPIVPVSRRGWIVIAVVVLVVGVSIWGIRAGYAPQIGRFFASEPGYVPPCAWHGEPITAFSNQCCSGLEQTGLSYAPVPTPATVPVPSVPQGDGSLILKLEDPGSLYCTPSGVGVTRTPTFSWSGTAVIPSGAAVQITRFNPLSGAFEVVKEGPSQRYTSFTQPDYPLPRPLVYQLRLASDPTIVSNTLDLTPDCLVAQYNPLSTYCVAPGCTVEQRSVNCDGSYCPGPITEGVCPAGITPPPRPTNTPTPTGEAGVPVDPTGACVWRSNFNAPEGAWFCRSLQCNLDGNNKDAPLAQRLPPSGPASRLDVSVLRAVEEPIDPARGPMHIRTVLDATPKNGNLEGYPPKDPLWTCTSAKGVMYQGRDGSDFYDCYNPIIHRTNRGPITCCANTGLSGDCITWDVDATPPPGVMLDFQTEGVTGSQAPTQYFYVPIVLNAAGMDVTAVKVVVEASPNAFLPGLTFEGTRFPEVLQEFSSDGRRATFTVGSGQQSISGNNLLVAILTVQVRADARVGDQINLAITTDSDVSATGHDADVLSGHGSAYFVVAGSVAKPGDADGNGTVDIFDYNLIVSNFNRTGSNVPGDLDGNGKVDIFDYNEVVSNFGRP